MVVTVGTKTQQGVTTRKRRVVDLNDGTWARPQLVDELSDTSKYVCARRVASQKDFWLSASSKSALSCSTRRLSLCVEASFVCYSTAIVIS